MNSLKKSPSLAFESLEQRDLLAGNVVVVEDGHLYIRGDELANQIAVVADESGQIAVYGLRDTTINGSSEPFVVGGSNSLNGVRGRNSAFDGGLRIKTFGGNDRVDIQGVELGDLSRIVTGEGDDHVRMMKSTSRHDFRVVTEDGDDRLNFFQARVHGDLSLRTATGHDSVVVRNTRTWGDSDISSGAGDDMIMLDRAKLTGDRQRVMTSEGEDQIVIRNSQVNESGLRVLAGDGRDHVRADMHNPEDVGGKIVVAGQGGYDVLDMNVDPGMAESFDQRGFVSGSDAEGAWFVFDNGQEMQNRKFNFRASAVEFEETTRIRSIDWLGSYLYSEAPENDNFVIEIFENEAIESVGGEYWFRQPQANAVAKFDIGNDANRLDTGEQWLDTTFHVVSEETGELEEGLYRKIFSYSAEIDFEFLADETYWISIYAMRTPGDEANRTDEYDFAVLLDYPGKPGELRDYVRPTGTQSEPFQNTNAVLFDNNAELGLEPNRWYFSSSAVQTIFSLY